MAEMTDEEALTYAENFANFFRASKRLVELIRYIRAARLDFPEMQRQMADLTGQIERAQTEAGAAQAALASVQAEVQPQIAALTDRRDQLIDEIARLERDRAATDQRLIGLTAQVRDSEAAVTTLSASIASLTEEENLLRLKVGKHEAALAEVRQNAAKLAGG